jgi:hypothetical protein
MALEMVLESTEPWAEQATNGTVHGPTKRPVDRRNV